MGDEAAGDSRSLVFEGLPGDGVAQRVKAPAPQAGEVLIGLLERKWVAAKTLTACLCGFPEAMEEIGGLAGGCFGRAREVDAAQ